MTLYMIFLLFICNLVASLSSTPIAPDNDASSVSQPCRGIDNQDLCEPMPHLLTGDTGEDNVSATGTALSTFTATWDTALEARAIVGKELSVTIFKEMGKCSTSVDCPPGYYCWRGGCVQIPRPASEPLLREDSDQDSPPADAQRCEHVTDCPVGKWCMDGFCWPFDQSTKLAARDADIGEASDDMKTQQRCHLHVQCGPGGLCINGWCQYVANTMSLDTTESVGVEKHGMQGPRKCTSDRDCYPRAVCVDGRCSHSHRDEDS